MNENSRLFLSPFLNIFIFLQLIIMWYFLHEYILYYKTIIGFKIIDSGMKFESYMMIVGKVCSNVVY